MRLSAVLAVFNEEPMLERGLELLGFCDEIVVVVDSRSDDRTEEIARRHTDRVWVEDFVDFAAHKNAAIERAQGDWVLVVDADERVTPALAREIKETLARDPAEWGFRFEIVSFFLGQRMRHGGWRQRHLRLVRREHARWDGAIHERLSIPPARVGELNEELWHFSHRSIQEMLAKTVRFGDVQSRELFEQGAPRVTPWTLARLMLRELAFRMVSRRGYKDGMPGVVESLYQPFSLFCVHVMLWQRQRGETLWETYQALERQAAEHR
jgi:glycosyltransferase involved in cell wall biosynthesis